MRKILATSFTVILATLTLLFSNIVAFAQDGAKDLNVDVDVNKGGGAFYTQPWVWIVGGAVFILLLVALMRGRGGRNDA